MKSRTCKGWPWILSRGYFYTNFEGEDAAGFLLIAYSKRQEERDTLKELLGFFKNYFLINLWVKFFYSSAAFFFLWKYFLKIYFKFFYILFSLSWGNCLKIPYCKNEKVCPEGVPVPVLYLDRISIGRLLTDLISHLSWSQ